MKYSQQIRSDAAAAVKRINKFGWIQREFGTNDGPCCSLGHIYFACEEDPKRENALCGSFRDIIKDESIINFNDGIERTKKDVVSVFRRIIAAE